MLGDEDLQKLYTWIDEIPLSRPKRNISRDFSDGVLVAEVVHHYFPRMVDVHNYVSANSAQQKMSNWSILNQKVFGRYLDFKVPLAEVESVVNCKPGAIESVLRTLQLKIARQKRKKLGGPSPGATPMSGEGFGGPLRPGGGAAHPAMYNNNSYHENNMPYDQGMQQHGGAGMGNMGMGMGIGQSAAAAAAAVEVDTELLVEKEQTIMELRETVEVGGCFRVFVSATVTYQVFSNHHLFLGTNRAQILELKVNKLEQLVRLKDSKIQSMAGKLQLLTPGPGQGQ